MTTSEQQDKIIEALAVEHGAVKVLRLRGTGAVLACGWFGSDAGEPVGPWWYVPADPAAVPDGGGPDDVPLRHAVEFEVRAALEQDAVRGLLSAAGLRP